MKNFSALDNSGERMDDVMNWVYEAVVKNRTHKQDQKENKTK